MKSLRILAILGGILMILLGFHAMEKIEDPSVLQGALTLGGGWIIAALFAFSPRWTWHGTGAIGVLALLGGARSSPGLLSAAQGGAPLYQAIAFAISAVLLVVTIVALKSERNRLTREKLLNAPD
ncbi:MAG: hypothetical protein MUF31_00790 [Akkermansiaceae bacterium]|jgi:hypothetical protein|nr:hypothetical protein [Akkermansiaceae bacterium]